MAWSDYQQKRGTGISSISFNQGGGTNSYSLVHSSSVTANSFLVACIF